MFWVHALSVLYFHKDGYVFEDPEFVRIETEQIYIYYVVSKIRT